MDKHRIEIFYSNEDKCFIANVVDVKYCSAHGDTQEEALREVKIALRAVLETLAEKRSPLPTSGKASKGGAPKYRRNIASRHAAMSRH